ncbi:MAG: nitrate reductase associated protein [Elainellaceae cyanobacterium]
MTFFKFEADFVQSLRCIPMAVRYKLDTCGVKLKLEHWNHFSEIERQSLVEQPCETSTDINEYRDRLQSLVTQHTGSPAKTLPIDEHPDWAKSDVIPAQVTQKGTECGTVITPEQWATLTPMQRFALIKLSRPSHENKSFVPALQEFNLL